MSADIPRSYGNAHEASYQFGMETRMERVINLVWKRA